MIPHEFFPIPNFKGYYLGFDPDDQGNASVWSVRNRSNTVKNPKKLKPFKHPARMIGYNLFDGVGKKEFKSLSFLICLVFHGNPGYGCKTIMKNKDGLYHPDNFEWSKRLFKGESDAT